ncbi:MAG TPA: glycosyltransferase family 39 protein [Opitutus sp.]|nr:glycosyltransferase family 39 protein [Opitutus sp.]
MPTPVASLRLHLALAALCAVVAAAAIAWTAWDMFGPRHRPMLQGSDDTFYYSWLPTVVIDHDLDFSNQLAHGGTIDPALRDRLLAQPRTATGLLPVKYPPGWAIGSLPFFLFARLLAPAGTTGFEPFYFVSVWFGQLVCAAAGLWLAVRILERYFDRGTAIVAVLVGWLASPLVYYQTARLSMSHSQAFALTAAVTWLALAIADGDARPRHWFLLGLCAALLVVTRNVAFVYLALPALVVVRQLRSPASAAWLIAGAAGPVAAQLVAWKILFGSWLAYSYGGERFDFAHLHLGAVLFSPLHGWFYWHPLLLVAIAVFVMWAWPRPEGRAWLASLAAITLLNAAWPTWWLGSSFGQRGFEAATLFAMLGLAALFEAVRRDAFWRRATAWAAALAIGWNVALLALFLTHRIPREQPVTCRDVVVAAVRWIDPSP